MRFHDSVGDLVEFLPCSVGSWILSQNYLHQRPVSQYLLSKAFPYRGNGAYLSQWTSLIACFVFGFAIASFLHRRRDRDGWQAQIFGALGLLGWLVGQQLGADTSATLLLFVPWALCLAMILSVMNFHWKCRGLRPFDNILHLPVSEKAAW